MKINTYELLRTDEIINKYKVSNLCAKILEILCTDDNEIEEVLNQNFEYTIDDTLVKPITDRILKAKEEHEKVLICGDYDCDGICATTILYDTLLKLDINCGYYIPNRFKEGYGLSKTTIENAFKKDYKLIITVDNGVKCKEAIAYAKSLNMDVIVTDHHIYEKEDLLYDYFLHPTILPEEYKYMCGAGMAYLLSCSLLKKQDSIHTILCGIATIADVMVLRKLNRKIVRKCIYLLNNFTYLPIVMLCDDQNRWNEKKIAFQIVPKINCIGRLAEEANANMLVKYLLLTDKNQIIHMSNQIRLLNDKRKNMTLKMEEKIVELLDDDLFPIVYSKSFHEGLCGLAASRYVHLLQRPIMVLSINEEGILKGSIRSESIDLSSFFDDIKHLFISYGGHKEAAGISFSLKHLNEIKNYIEMKMKSYVKEDKTLHVLSLNKDEININELESLDLLRPFGQGFKLPLFSIIENDYTVSKIGNNKHLKYSADRISYLKFNDISSYENDINKTSLNFIGELSINEFYGKKSIQMIIEHIKKV